MKNLIAIIVVVLVALGLSSLYVVKEGERAILIQFGKVERNAETGEAMVRVCVNARGAAQRASRHKRRTDSRLCEKSG